MTAPVLSKKVIDALTTEKVEATFFVLGVSVDRFGASILERALKERHCIGNHSYGYNDSSKPSKWKIRYEIGKADDLLKEYVVESRLFRSPYGASNATVDQIVEEFGYRKVMWNADTLDWKEQYKQDKSIQHAIDQTIDRNISIVLARTPMRIPQTIP